MVYIVEACVSSEQAHCLKKFLETCPQPEAAPQSLTASYWISTDAAQQPSNPVEAFVGSLLNSADVCGLVGPVEGAEWWWQDTDHTDPPKVSRCSLRALPP